MLMPASTASLSIAASSSVVNEVCGGGAQVLLKLGDAARADQHRRHPRVAQRPGQRELRERLAARRGYPGQRADVRQRRLGKLIGRQRAVKAGPRPGGHAGKVLPRQHALRQRRERDTAHALTAEQVQQPALDPAVQHRVRRLVDQQRGTEAPQYGDGLRGAFRRIGGDARVQRPARTHRGIQGAHRLLKGGIRVEAVGVEDVDVVEAHPAQRLVQAGQQVLPGAVVAVGTRPHVVAGLGGDDQLVPVRPQVLAHDPAEIDLGRAVRRSVVICQVEVGDPEVEGAPDDRALVLDRLAVPEVLPQPE